MDTTRLQQFFNLSTYEFLLRRSMPVRGQCNRLCIRLQSHFMDIINTTGRRHLLWQLGWTHIGIFTQYFSKCMLGTIICDTEQMLGCPIRQAFILTAQLQQVLVR